MPRRTFQFRLRTLLLAAVAVALACGLAKTFIGRTLAERRAAALIKSQGGEVDYYGGIDNSFGAAAEIWSPAPDGNPLIRLFVGDGPTHVGLSPPTEQAMRRLSEFQDLQHLYLSDAQLSDDMLQSMAQLRQVPGMTLSNVTVDDSADKDIRWPESLEALAVENCTLPDRACESLTRLKLLKTLYFLENSISDSQLGMVGTMPNLEILVLSGSDVSDAGVLQISGQHNLHHLRLSKTSVTDEATDHISTFQALRTLDLSECSISDSGIPPLTRLNQLEHLDLADTNITVASTPVLAKFKHLKTLEISRTPLSRNAQRALQDAIPNVEIRTWREKMGTPPASDDSQ